jgi:hypothetical protein
MTLQPARQLHTSEVCDTDSGTRQCADHAVNQRTESQMSSNTSPATRQLSGRIPSHAKLQRQRIANNDPGRRLARNAVRSRSRNRSRRNRLGRRVNQHIHARSNVQVAKLQRARQRNDHRCVDIAQAALSICFFRGTLLELIFQCARRERLCGYAAGQGRVVVDVEFQQVEERVVDEVDRAVDVFLYAKEEFQRAAGFIAGREWDIRQLACSVGNMFAGVASVRVNTNRLLPLR